MSVTLFSSRFTQLSVTMRSRPSGFFSVSPIRLPSMAFICLGAAEINRSHSAPSLICLSRVPEESKLYVTVTLGLFCSYISLSWFMVSVIEAAANTISSTGSPAGVSVGALSCV